MATLLKELARCVHIIDLGTQVMENSKLNNPQRAVFDQANAWKSLCRMSIALAVALYLGLSWASEWQLVAEEESSDIYIRMDSSKGQNWLVDVLINFKRSQKIEKTFSSSVDRMEFDCRNEKVRTLTMANYKDPMGSGSVTFESTQPADWKPIEKGSVNSELFRIGCENRKSWT